MSASKYVCVCGVHLKRCKTCGYLFKTSCSTIEGGEGSFLCTCYDMVNSLKQCWLFPLVPRIENGNISCTMCVCVFLCGEVHDHRVSFSEALRSGTVQIEKAEETSRLDIPASQACRISLQVVSAQMRSGQAHFQEPSSATGGSSLASARWKALRQSSF